MKYKKIQSAVFIDRPNRFIAHVEIDGKPETVHVKNTGRCRELLYKGAPVWLEESDNPNRKTNYDLVVVEKNGIGLINMDSQAPNKVVDEWLRTQPAAEILCGSRNDSIDKPAVLDFIKPEYTYGSSRIDFYARSGEQEFLMEVKGVTLEIDGTAYFPDAPTLRGIKHIEELIKAQQSGYQCFLAFVIQMQGVDRVLPNTATHPEFGEALQRARGAGVKVLNLGCQVRTDELFIDRIS